MSTRPRSLQGRRRAAALAAAVLAALGPGPASAQPHEDSVKAAYLTKFDPFVEWPPVHRPPAGGPVVLCVAGDDPLGRDLDQIATGAGAAGRTITVRRMATLEAADGCHILYAAGTARQSAADMLRAVGAAPVLTVTDASRGGAGQGIIHFVVKDNRVRFHVDDEAAARQGIVLSSKLLSLAVSVKPRSREPRP